MFNKIPVVVDEAFASIPGQLAPRIPKMLVVVRPTGYRQTEERQHLVQHLAELYSSIVMLGRDTAEDPSTWEGKEAVAEAQEIVGDQETLRVGYLENLGWQTPRLLKKVIDASNRRIGGVVVIGPNLPLTGDLATGMLDAGVPVEIHLDAVEPHEQEASIVRELNDRGVITIPRGGTR